MSHTLSGQQLILTSLSGRPLRPLVENALRRELAILEAGVRQTQKRLKYFETQYGFSTEVFLKRLQEGTMNESLETIEWVGEQRMLERLFDKISLIREIHLAD